MTAKQKEIVAMIAAGTYRIRKNDWPSLRSLRSKNVIVDITPGSRTGPTWKLV